MVFLRLHEQGAESSGSFYIFNMSALGSLLFRLKEETISWSKCLKKQPLWLLYSYLQSCLRQYV